MKIIEKNEGKKINYNLTGTKLDFADGALTIDLARYQQDDPVTRDIPQWIQNVAIHGPGTTTNIGSWGGPDGSALPNR